jgi:hypothetical protein
LATKVIGSSKDWNALLVMTQNLRVKVMEMERVFSVFNEA